MLRNTDRKCPMCKQTFLLPDDRASRSIFSWFSFFSRSQRRAEEELARMRELFPNHSEIDILREIERAGSVQAAIESLLGE